MAYIIRLVRKRQCNWHMLYLACSVHTSLPPCMIFSSIKTGLPTFIFYSDLEVRPSYFKFYFRSLKKFKTLLNIFLYNCQIKNSITGFFFIEDLNQVFILFSSTFRIAKEKINSLSFCLGNLIYKYFFIWSFSRVLSSKKSP